MRVNIYKGKFILVEGLDGGGKTTAAKPAAAELKMTYLKGLGRDDGFGRLAKKYSMTFFFMLEAWYVSTFILKKMLRRGENVLVDKFFFSAASYIPDVDRWYNRFFIKLCRVLILKPDAVIFFDVSPDIRIMRLKNDPPNKFHQELADNREWLVARNKKLKDILKEAKFRPYVVDTTRLKTCPAKENLKSKIRPYLKARR